LSGLVEGQKIHFDIERSGQGRRVASNLRAGWRDGGAQGGSEPIRRSTMSREGLLEVDGVVTSLLPNLMARVLLDNGQEILAMSAGRLRRHRIRLLVGDRVTVEMTPYDLSRGRINFRHKDDRSPASRPPEVRAARRARR
jgi:translation initiation factor IF-1